jgi:hypothetical protein
MAAPVYLLVVFTAAIHGQQTTPTKSAPTTKAAPKRVEPTRIGQHHINETFEQWHQIEGDGLIEPHEIGETIAEWRQRNNEHYCKDAHDEVEAKVLSTMHSKTMDDLHKFEVEMCDDLTPILNTGSGDFVTSGPEHEGQYGTSIIRWHFEDGKFMSYRPEEKPNENRFGEPRLITYQGVREYKWIFADNRLVKILIEPKYNEFLNFTDEAKLLSQMYGMPLIKKGLSAGIRENIQISMIQ